MKRLLMATSVVFSSILLFPLVANMATCPEVSGTFNCGAQGRFVCGSQCLSQGEIDGLAGSCINFSCGSCSCADSGPNTTPKTPAYLNVADNNGYLKIGGAIDGLDGLTISGTSSLSNVLVKDFRVYRTSGDNAEIKIQSTAGDNSHWGIYQDRTSGELRFWNNQTGNNMVVSPSGNIFLGGEKDMMGQGSGSVIFLKDAGFWGGKNLSLLGGSKINFNGPGYGSIYYSTSTRSTIISGGGGNSSVIEAALGVNNNGIDFVSDKNRFLGDVYIGKIGSADNLYVDDGEIKGKWLHATSPEGESSFAGKVYIAKGLVAKGDTWLDSGKVYVNNSTFYINSNTARSGQVLTAADDGSAVWRDLPPTSSRITVTPGLADVLKAGSNASNFSGTIYLGNQYATPPGVANLSVTGGEVRAKWINAIEQSGVNSFAGNILAQKDFIVNGTSTLAGKIRISSGAGAGKVLTSDAGGAASWQSLPAMPSYSTSTLAGVLNQDANASAFSGNVYLGDLARASNLYVAGGEIEGGWIHAISSAGTSTFAGDINVAKNLKAGQVNVDYAYGIGGWPILQMPGDTNIALGRGAWGGGTGRGNSALGYFALSINSSGISNTAVGAWTLQQNTTGNRNSAFGAGSLTQNISGKENTALGSDALGRNDLGNDNTAIGVTALYNNLGGGYNTGVGVSSLYYNTTGSWNTGLGMNSLYNNTIGSFNTALGRDAISANTTGNRNIAIGYRAGSNLTTGSDNIIIGNSIALPAVNSSSFLNIGNAIFGNLSSGNIGIGVSNPDVKLVVGSGSGTGNIIGINGADDQYAGLRLSVAGAEKWFIGTDSAVGTSNLIIRGGGADRVIFSDAALTVNTPLKLGSTAAKGLCNAANVGKMVYEEISSVGHFYGCIRTGSATYIWKQLDN